MNDKRKIAVYGLSTETERELPGLMEKYDIAGLLDSFRTDGEIYGQPIISMDKAISDGTEMIIVVARPGSCKAITKKIGNVCRNNNIQLFDIRGKNLLETNRVVYDFLRASMYTKADALEAIEKVDVVSFDLFDTLVIRNIAASADVIELVNERLKETGGRIDSLVVKRLAAEKFLSQKIAPRLFEIYNEFLDGTEQISAEQISNFEFGIDKSLLIPRTDTVELLYEARKRNKKIYITTDSYYSRSQIEEILQAVQICNYDDLIVSCEYGVGKTQGLFDELINIAGTKSILHIGDDVIADIEYAEKAGIKSFHIYSGAELLDILGGLGLEDKVESLSDKIKVGMFISRIFNSPFQFEDETCRVEIEDAFDIGYLLCAPMILDFAYWFGKQVEEFKLSNILFCARDGYLLQKIYPIIYPGAKTHYFLTSRISAIRAGVSNDADIAYVDSMKFSGEVEDNLKIRFGIDAEKLTDSDIDQNECGLKRYSRAILKSAQIKRKYNQKYIDDLKMGDGSVALFDFVAKGTSQMYIQKLLPNEIQGLYFLQLEPEFMRDKGLKIQPFYKEGERDGSAIFDNYYILETLLTSPAPSVDEFDENGNPVYAKETRSDKDILCFMGVQEGIIKYVERYLDICPRNAIQINKELDETFLTLVHNVEIRDKSFLELTVEDPFFNRMTVMTDVL